MSDPYVTRPIAIGYAVLCCLILIGLMFYAITPARSQEFYYPGDYGPGPIVVQPQYIESPAEVEERDREWEDQCRTMIFFDPKNADRAERMRRRCTQEKR